MKRRLFVYLLVFVMLFSILPNTAFCADELYAGGSGTASDPYLIETKYHLDNVRLNLSKNFKLISNIEFTDEDFEINGDFYNNGEGWVPIGNKADPFKGSFDGNGFTIKNIYVCSKSAYVGLFGCIVSSAKYSIENLSILDGEFMSLSDENESYVGSFVGFQRSKTYRCYSNSKVYPSPYSKNSYVGGIVGFVFAASIEICGFSGFVSSKQAFESCQQLYAGGVVGRINEGVIQDCYNSADVYFADCPAKAWLGGLAGISLNDKAVRCYNAGLVLAENPTETIYSGALFGWDQTFGSKLCYFLDNNANSSESSINGDYYITKLNSDQFKQQSSFLGFDFEYVWKFDTTTDYPYPELKLKRNEDIESISVMSQPENKIFVEGVDLDFRGYAVRIRYKDGLTDELRVQKWMLCDFDENYIGTQNLYIKIGDVSSNDTILIERVKKSVNSIEIESLPDKILYHLGEKFDSTGLLVKVKYNNNTEEYIDNYEIIGFDSNSIGEKIISVKFNGVLNYFTVYVNEIKSFSDVPKNAWYKQYVDYAVSCGLFSGTGEKTFSPNTDMTRAQFVQVLANIAGEKLDNNVTTGFLDAPNGKWFTGAVKWAVENSIASGTGAGKFNPTGKIDRQQMCVMLVNYIENYEKKTLKEAVEYKTFADDAAIAGWAKTAVIKCFKAGLVSGTGNNKFSPKVVANRATGATIFTNFHKGYIS